MVPLLAHDALGADSVRVAPDASSDLGSEPYTLHDWFGEEDDMIKIKYYNTRCMRYSTVRRLRLLHGSWIGSCAYITKIT